MKKPLTLLKLGGAFLTDKSGGTGLLEDRARRAGREIQDALEVLDSSRILLGHGAGSFGHLPALHYGAVHGIHPRWGWEGFHVIRRSMARLSLRLQTLWDEVGFHPVPVQPSAIALAEAGRLKRMSLDTLRALLHAGQTPVLHGDVVLDRQRGFTIASTEAQMAYLTQHLPIRRIVMVTDVPGVLDQEGRVIPRITRTDLDAVRLGGAGGADVTGGMRHKVLSLLDMLDERPGVEGRILSGLGEPGELTRALLGESEEGTLVLGQDAGSDRP